MSEDLHKLYPFMCMPMRCENGCGAVVEIADTFRSYQRREDNSRKLICQCCAAEMGHADEHREKPWQTPVCKRPIKRKLR